MEEQEFHKKQKRQAADLMLNLLSTAGKERPTDKEGQIKLLQKELAGMTLAAEREFEEILNNPVIFESLKHQALREGLTPAKDKRDAILVHFFTAYVGEVIRRHIAQKLTELTGDPISI